MEFIQSSPSCSNPYLDDRALQSVLFYFLDKKNNQKRQKIHQDLCDFSRRIVSEINPLGQRAECHPPRHVPYSAWGERVDEIIVDEAWKKLDAISAEEKLIKIGYTRDSHGGHRLHQFAKLYLFHPSSAFYSCPLAMTDGAASLIEMLNFPGTTKEAYEHLTSDDPQYFWTSGQWMTEKKGGSDVSQTQTLARKRNGQWYLYGEKWFTSATTSQMAMTLARIEQEDGTQVEGSRGLSLFYIKLRDANGKLQNIKVNRLKDKLGTKALPTAELTLDGTPAELIGTIGRGVAEISALFNITRLYNACCCVGAFQHLVQLSCDYSNKREAFGKKIIEHPLHQKMLKNLKAQHCALLLFSFYVIDLLDSVEMHNRPVQNKILRILTPILKLYTAKINLKATTELIESFGGAGYIEDTGLPRWLRDAQVLTIWEGTTNVLALDMLRAIEKDKAHIELFIELKRLLSEVKNSQLDQAYKKKAQSQLDLLKSKFSFLESNEKEIWQFYARDLAFSLARTFEGLLTFILFDHCDDKSIFNDASKLYLLKDWVQFKDI